MPNLFVIAGPNGAGKSTSAPELLTGPRRVEQFVNADVIASERGVMNNAARPGRRIASRDVGDALSVKDNDLWNQLVTRYMKPRVEQEQAIAAPQKLWTAEDIVEAVNRAVTAALKRHKELGQSIVVWRDGKLVTLGPEEIET